MIRVIPFLFLLSAAAGAPAGSDADVDPLQSAWEFALDLLKTVSAGAKDNVLVSPVSVGVLLSMLQQGAGGATSEQLQSVLRMTSEASRTAYGDALTNVQAEDSNTTLECGSAAYIREGFNLSDSFKTVVENTFRSNVEIINFVDPSTQDAANRINEWISNATHGYINDLLKPTSLGAETIMVMTNGIYFKGVWKSVFHADKTRSDMFHRPGDTATTVEYMRQEEDFQSGVDEALGIKWLQLPYEDERFAMLFVLPNDPDGLVKLMDTIKGKDLKRIAGEVDVHHTKVNIPKFKLTWKSSLVEPLKKMGLSDIFTEKADLRGITKTGTTGLRLSEIVHQANIEVDEDGTTASAASYDIVVELSLLIDPDEINFNADHPFLAFIIDKTSKIPLFASVVNDPTASQTSSAHRKAE